MIALDALEQMHAQPFELIGADAGRDGLAGRIQIGLGSPLRSTAAWSCGRPKHRKTAILPSRATATAECSSCVLPASSAQLLRRLRAAGRLAEQTVSERQRLIGADDITAGIFRRYEARLLARQQPSDLAGRGKAGIFLHGSFVDIGGNGLEGNAGIGKQHLPRAALRGQDQRIFSAPDGHRIRIIPEAAAAGDR